MTPLRPLRPLINGLSWAIRAVGKVASPLVTSLTAKVCKCVNAPDLTVRRRARYTRQVINVL